MKPMASVRLTVMSLDPKQVQDVFLAALEGTDSFNRATILETRCRGDQVLRNRVEALLRAHDDPCELPLPRAGMLPPLDTSGDYEPGTVIAGRYELEEEIAAGGMGTVWLARQSQPVSRRVALKLIKPGMDSRRLLSRFDAERQALALMNHPHIAQVYDGGLTEWGHPYFAMEYVPGEPVTEACDAARHSIPERLSLFVQICEAIQHAHRKGIIHRDLKPSNVLVVRSEGQAVPKIIDFGLAMVIQDAATAETQDSLTGHPAGTPRYMSPEQAQPGQRDVDTRSDVYSLGVLLYELIAGTTPLAADSLKGASWTEIVRLISEQEAIRPSALLSRDANLAEVAAARAERRTELVRQVRGDLDAIVLKALEKEPRRRYQSVGELAGDVRRYLQHEPVDARLPTASYRMRKFARRHRVALSMAAIIGVSLMVATGISIAQAVRASRAEQVASAERDAAVRERANAEANLRDARAAVDQYFTQVSESKLLTVPGMQPLRKELLTSALAYYQEFVKRHESDPRLQADLASAYLRIGTILGAVSSRAEARDAFASAVAILETLVRQQPASAAFRDQLARALDKLGQTERGLSQSDAAQASFQRALDIRQQLLAEQPQNAAYQASLVAAWTSMASVQGLEAAARSYQEAITLGEQLVGGAPEDRPHVHLLARALNEYGVLERKAGRLPNAESAYRRSLQFREQLVREEPDKTEYLVGLNTTYNNLFVALVELGQMAEAENAFQRSVDFYTQLRDANPSVIAHRRELANAYNNLGAVQRMAGRLEESRDSLAHSRQLYEQLVAEHPGVSEYRLGLGMTNYNLGVLHATAGRPELAREAWNAMANSYAAAINLGDTSLEAYTGLGDASGVLGRWDEAASAFARATEVSQDAWKPLYQLALLRLAAGDLEGYRQSCQHLLDRYGDTTNVAEGVAVVMACMAAEQSVDNPARVVAVAERVAATNPKNPVFATLLGAAQYRAGDAQAAIATLKRSLPMHSLAAIVAPRQVDQIRISRLTGETMLALALRHQEDQQAFATQLEKLTKLVETLEKTTPQFSEGIARWALPLSLVSARRELARLQAGGFADPSSTESLVP